jgi:hypothetical protein
MQKQSKSFLPILLIPPCCNLASYFFGILLDVSGFTTASLVPQPKVSDTVSSILSAIPLLIVLSYMTVLIFGIVPSLILKYCRVPWRARHVLVGAFCGSIFPIASTTEGSWGPDYMVSILIFVGIAIGSLG